MNILIMHKYCAHSNCDIRASYNYNNEKRPVYCQKHKQKNMINTLLFFGIYSVYLSVVFKKSVYTTLAMYCDWVKSTVLYNCCIL